MLHGNLKMFARNIVLYVRHRPIMCRWFYVYSLNPCPTIEVMTNCNKVGFLLMSVHSKNKRVKIHSLARANLFSLHTSEMSLYKSGG